MSPYKFDHAAKSMGFKPARAPQGIIKGIYSVGGSHNDDLASRVQAIHQCKQRAHDGVVDLVLPAAPGLRHTQTGCLKGSLLHDE